MSNLGTESGNYCLTVVKNASSVFHSSLLFACLVFGRPVEILLGGAFVCLHLILFVVLFNLFKLESPTS